MSVAECLPAESLDTPRLLRWAALACAPEGFDPMDRAIAQAAGPPGDGRFPGAKLCAVGRSACRHAGLASGRRVELLVAAKGAPEAIIELCRLDPATAASIRATVEAMAERGMRVLGVAHAEIAEGPLPETPRGYAFQWAGLVGLADPLRPEVPGAIAECRAAGIRVVMITGDYPATAQAIARAAGLSGDAVLTGAELSRLADAGTRGPGRNGRSLRAHPAGAEAAHRRGAAGQGRGRCDDRRWRERRAEPQGGGHRYRHGRPRHGRRARGRPRSSCSTTISARSSHSAARPPDLRQSAQGDGAISSPCTCRSPASHCCRC